MDPAAASISTIVSSDTRKTSQRRRERRASAPRISSHDCYINSQTEVQPNYFSSPIDSYLSTTSQTNVDRLIKHMPIKFNATAILILALIIVSLIVTLIGADEEARPKLSICERYQACAAEISHFPLLSETVGEMRAKIDNANDEDGSGEPEEGSGDSGRRPVEIDFPLYDEFVTAQPLFDYNTDAEHDQTNICQCPDRDEVSGEETNGCELGATDGENVLRVDKSIRLAFCRPINELFHMKCLGRRAVLRIIGDVDPKTGEALVNINDTAVFCRCEAPLEFRRVAIEPWQDKYAFVYRCSAP